MIKILTIEEVMQKYSTTSQKTHNIEYVALYPFNLHTFDTVEMYILS